jgi:nucleotide-binding universal stress UspA family protein
MKPILLATDGSPSADAATREAIDLARAFGAPLIVVSVAQPVLPTYGAYYGYTELAADLRETEAEHVAQTLAGVRERAIGAGVECETVALEGSPAGAEICGFAHENVPRLVVVGAHGWGRLGRLLHGSVSTHVLHHAPCPVLVVLGEDGHPPEAITTMNGAAAKAGVVGGAKRR